MSKFIDRFLAHATYALILYLLMKLVGFEATIIIALAGIQMKLNE